MIQVKSLLRFFVWALLTLVAANGSVNPVAASEPLFPVETARLENGLELVVIPNHRSPVVHHMVWYKVGAADEERGKSGLAHFFEHLMFRGTKTLADGDYSKTVARLGGSDNAFTGQDFTAYHVSIAKEFLPDILTMEADRMQGLVLSDEVIETERAVILEERRSRVDASPFARFSERLNSILFPNHPYGIPVIGWAHEIKDLTHADVRAFYDRWYAPNNAMLVVSGDITLADFKPMAEKAFGSLKPRGTFEPRQRPQLPDLPVMNHVDLAFSDAQIRNPIWRKTWVVPSERQDPNTSYALSLLVDMLASSESAPLHRLFVTEKNLTLSADLGYSGSGIDDGTLDVSFVLKDSADKDRVEQAWADFLKEAHLYLTPEALDASKNRMEAAALYARDGLDTPARIVGQSLTVGLTLEAVQNWVPMIRAVELDEVIAALDKTLRAEAPLRPVVTSFLTPLQAATIEQPETEVQP